MISIESGGALGRPFGPILALLAATITASVPSVAIAAPKVATDIGPVYSLVAQIMDGVGVPQSVMPVGASPHDHALRPSEARVLADADLVVWIGPALSPQLERALGSLARDTPQLTLLETDGTRLLATRVGAAFEKHDHGHDEEDHADGDHAGEDHADEDQADKDHAGEDHADEDHADEDHADEDHDDEKHADDGHAGDMLDPHAWLDPKNGSVWALAIAERLAHLDPENAELYHANAGAVVAEISALETRIETDLAKVHGRPFFVLHDATQYFEARFGVEASGAIAPSDDSAPGPARLRSVREAILQLGSVCVFAEPGPDADRLNALTAGTDARIGILDPLGALLPLDKDLYPMLLATMGTAFHDCL